MLIYKDVLCKGGLKGPFHVPLEASSPSSSASSPSRKLMTSAAPRAGPYATFETTYGGQEAPKAETIKLHIDRTSKNIGYP